VSARKARVFQEELGRPGVKAVSAAMPASTVSMIETSPESLPQIEQVCFLDPIAGRQQTRSAISRRPPASPDHTKHAVARSRGAPSSTESEISRLAGTGTLRPPTRRVDVKATTIRFDGLSGNRSQVSFLDVIAGRSGVVPSQRRSDHTKIAERGAPSSAESDRFHVRRNILHRYSSGRHAGTCM
jgi:hypothetical protein